MAAATDESKELSVCSKWTNDYELFKDLTVRVSWGQDWLGISMSHRDGRQFDLSVSKDELIQHGFTQWDTAEQAAQIMIDALEQGSVDGSPHRREVVLEQIYNDELSMNDDSILLRLTINDYCGRTNPFRYTFEMKEVTLPSKTDPSPRLLSALAKPFVMSEESKENVRMNKNRINVYHSSSVTKDGSYMKWDITDNNDLIVWDESKSRMTMNQDCIVKVSGMIAVSESKSKVLSCAVEMNGKPAVYSVGRIQSQSEMKHPSGPSPMISLPFGYAFSAKKSDCCKILVHGNVFQCPTFNVLIVEILS